MVIRTGLTGEGRREIPEVGHRKERSNDKYWNSECGKLVLFRFHCRVPCAVRLQPYTLYPTPDIFQQPASNNQ